MKKSSSLLLFTLLVLIGQPSVGQELSMNGVRSPQSILSNDSCLNAIAAAHGWEEDLYNYGPAYDTMKWYISHCYSNPSGETWSVFGGSLDSVIKTEAGRQDVFDFVLYALGLNSNDGWFCAAVPYLGVGYYDNAVTNSIDYRDQMAIYKFLMDNPRCAANYTNDSEEFYNLRNSYFNLWSDTAQPGEVCDTTIPTLQELGLDTLLKINADAGVTYALPTPAIILSASITENPFENSTSVSISVGREAYLTIQIFDLLGHQIAGAGYAGVFEQGSREIPVNMENAPPGAYYVRISTANNETQTLKLVKE